MKYEKAVIDDQTQISLEGLTVLVGPNNSGKSSTLKDIFAVITGDQDRKLVLVKSLIRDPTVTLEMLREHARGYTKDDQNYSGIDPRLRGTHSFRVGDPSVTSWINSEFAGTNSVAYRQQFGKFEVAMLDAESRLELAKSTPSHDVATEEPSNLLQLLYKNETIQAALDEAFSLTFNEHIAFDYTSLKNLYLRVGPDFRTLPPRAEDANRILNSSPTLDSQGDGMRSFAAVILSLLLTNERIILLDEPDAFLHPEQARRLGRWIGQHSKSSNQQIIVATHNSHFLQGMISAAANPQIYRLDRKNNESTKFNLIPANVVAKFGTDPLLSSQRVIESIFHTVSVVCESDSDRTIYQAVAAQTLNNNQVLFVNAQNKQTCGRVIAALRQAGIIARSVVDIDMLRDGDDLVKLMEAHEIPQIKAADLREMRKLIADAVEQTPDSDDFTHIPDELRLLAEQIESSTEQGINKSQLRARLEDLLRIGKWDPLKKGGTSTLEGETRELANKLISDLKEFQLMIVPVGELESWIDLDVRKSRWVESALVEIFEDRTPTPLKDFVSDLCQPL